MNDHPEKPDAFEKSEYRRLFAWSDRLQREWPLLERILSTGPHRRLLDLGCGSGEHSAFLQEKGFSVTGVDASPKQIESARSLQSPTGPEFVLSTIGDLGGQVDGTFGAALCVGNVLPYLDADELDRSFATVASLVDPGAPWLLQIVNYPGLRERGVRTLPVNVRPGDSEDEELVLLRLMRFSEEGKVLFSPSTLRWRPGEDPPVTVQWTKTILLEAWSADDLVAVAARHSFEEVERFGSVEGEAFDPIHSHDIILHLRRK